MSSLLINEPPLQVLPTLAHRIGLNEALMLQQVHYWLNPKLNRNIFENRHWVHNTYRQWQAQFPFWSVRTIQRILLSLEEKGLLLAFLKNDFQKTKHYTIDYDQLHRMEFISTKILSRVSPQTDVIDRATLSDPSRQIGTIDHDKLARLYIDTETTDRDNIPPLTPPSNFFSGLNWEEDENSKEDLQNKPIENVLLQAWVDIWNEIIQSKFLSSRPVLLNSSRIQKFKRFRKEISIEDLKGWRRYCQKIHQSRFLMGHNATGFRATLDWALNPINAFKILEGAIYDKPREEEISSERKLSEKPWSEYVENLKQHCLDQGYSDRWFKTCKTLSALLGQVTFENWFKAMVPEEQDEGMVHLTVESPFMRDYIKTHYISALEKAFSAAFPQQTRFEIQAGTDPPWEPQ